MTGKLYLKRRNGWKKTTTWNYPARGPEPIIRIPDHRIMTATQVFREGLPSTEESYHTIQFQLVKSAVITDHRTHEQRIEAWYEEH